MNKMDNLNTSEVNSISEAILKYLEVQEIITNDAEEGYLLNDRYSELMYVRNFLDQIIKSVTNRAQLIEDFQAKLKAHNQYPLFDLSTILPDFTIDQDLYDKLTFRETLIISYLDDEEEVTVPKVVGGLCLDIQKAKGRNPLYRKTAGLEQKLIELITEKLNALRKASKQGAETLNKSEEVSVRIEPELTQSKQELEEFTAKIAPRYEHTYCKFLVHLSSQFDVEGNMAGSRVTAWVDRNFHTLEEKRTEFLKGDTTMNEKKLYYALQSRRYFVKYTSTTDNIEDKKYYSLAKTSYLIGEGANFILMRYLAITKYMGKFEVSTMYINGNMCRNIYECTGPDSGIVNEQKLDICKIYRTVIEECDIIHNCVTILTLSGQIVKQEWQGCNYVLQLNPLAHISNEKPTGNEHLILERVWEQDIQLLSKYLDNKTTCVMSIKSYLEDHPELKNMLADYVQYVLLMKPDDIFEFTIQYFTHFDPVCMEKRSSLYTDYSA